MDFFAGRLSVTESPQVSIFTGNASSVHEIVAKLFGEGFVFETSRDVTIFHEPIFYNNLYVGGKLGRQMETQEPVFDETEKRFLERSQTSAPYVFYAYIESQQIFFVERRTTVFRDLNSVLRYIEEYMNSKMDKGSAATVRPLTEEGRFWEHLASPLSLKEVTLTFRTPNFLGEFYADTAGLLREINQETSAQEVAARYANEHGELKIPRNNDFKQAINWIESGGGEWELKGNIDGGTRRLKSGKSIKIFTVDIERENITPELLANLEHLIPWPTVKAPQPDGD